MKRRSLLLSAAALPFAGAARANNFPNGPFRIIVPFGAGSATDQGARHVAEGLNRTFGVPAVVENKPGANGAIAAEVAAKARPDGHMPVEHAPYDASPPPVAPPVNVEAAPPPLMPPEPPVVAAAPQPEPPPPVPVIEAPPEKPKRGWWRR